MAMCPIDSRVHYKIWQENDLETIFLSHDSDYLPLHYFDFLAKKIWYDARKSWQAEIFLRNKK